jgi:signal transduction histidine kinase
MKAGDASEAPATDYLLTAASQVPRLAGYMQRQLDAERGVIAKELHDELGGLLVAAKMDVSHALRQLPQAHPEVRERLAQVQHSLDEAIALERRVVERLQPGLLMHVGLFSAVRWYAEDMVALLGGSFKSKLPLDEVPLNQPTRIGLYRILQDALERAAASSKSAIEVGAQVQANVLELQVVHRALPLSATAAGEDDLRVLAMLQRATAIGGELSMGGNDEVTRLVVRLPLGGQAAG